MHSLLEMYKYVYVKPVSYYIKNPFSDIMVYNTPSPATPTPPVTKSKAKRGKGLAFSQLD